MTRLCQRFTMAVLRLSWIISYIASAYYYVMTFNACRDTSVNVLAPLYSSDEEVLPTCPETPPNLVGTINVSTDVVNMKEAEQELVRINNIMPGGRYKPKHCLARHKVAIVIPFKDREEHLAILLKHFHPLLQKQEVAYTIFVVEQTGDSRFNRGMMSNIGFLEALRLEFFECFIFQDVDMLPENDYNLHTCPKSPRHMGYLLDKYSYKPAFEKAFGGVVAFPTSDFSRINGFSNQFWSWGGEDDDLLQRVLYHNLSTYRINEPKDALHYKTLYHKRQELNHNRWILLQKNITLSKYDGLTNLRYKLIRKTFYPLYTRISVRV